MRTNQSKRPILLIVIAWSCLCVGQVANAASQGQWGRTSTATAKITLRIPPKPDHPLGFNSAQFQNGFESLSLYCNSLRSDKIQGITTPYFQISLAETTNPQPLVSVLNTHCTGGNSLVEPSLSSNTATLIIAPY